MKVDEVRAWGGDAWVPERFRGQPGPFEISEAMLSELSKRFDVAFMHHAQPQPTRRERGQGTQPVPDKLVLWLDTIGGKFRQR